ncbi:MAG: hypothetical protein QCH31_11250, partial [Methanolobus sp.]|nr:hypothetical protein [Methanolobus sp.]
MAITIEGTAFPLGKINKNGWGIPTSEASSAIASLKKAVVHICPCDNGHGCDLSEDSNHEIGRVIDAWSTPTSEMVRVEISEKVAEQKILSGVWERTWSVYGKASSIFEGWAQGFQARSLTLVRDPAWDEASFNVVAS